MKRTLPAESEHQVSQVRAAADRCCTNREQNIMDNRPSTIAQRLLIENMHSSPKAIAQRRMAALFQNKANTAIQRTELEYPESPLSQRVHDGTEHGLFQGKFALKHQAQRRQSFIGESNHAIQRQIWSTGALDNLQTNVSWATSKIQGDGTGTTVGVKMIANPLGPDHLQGGPPKSGAQKGLMRQLPTDPKLLTDQKYIRGHLLNDNVGGPGEDFNLFPITGEANHQHERFIESTVKSWVNDQKQWVKYTVEAKPVKVDLQAKTINADFDCEAQLLNPANAMQPMDMVKATIPSIYKGRPLVDGSKANPSGNLAPVGPQAAKHNPHLSLAKKNAHEYKLDDKVFQAIQEWASMYGGKEIIDFQKIESIGKALGALFEDVLEDALKFGNLPQTLDKAQKANLTKLNKKADKLIENFYGLIKKDFGEEFLKVMTQDPVEEQDYTTSYGYSTGESIFDYMPEPQSSFSDTLNFSPQPVHYQPVPQQQYQNNGFGSLNQSMGFVPQNMSMLGSNFPQSPVHYQPVPQQQYQNNGFGSLNQSMDFVPQNMSMMGSNFSQPPVHYRPAPQQQYQNSGFGSLNQPMGFVPQNMSALGSNFISHSLNQFQQDYSDTFDFFEDQSLNGDDYNGSDMMNDDTWG
ncbi:DNA/RNA non-specific endonuclease [Nitrosomonas oligotropha]|uniref:DNA/RNA non-specific endonuclease n=1 Tax=Nitrosomonas oligotropha TaxID=42354 RepID=A0A2T5I4L2_9PROT|nr:DNA/RNA non-specific endonuclease [Nitrosomonas oligotropha]PTQ78764.1 DNA/RNA non-specific endonuclease [Nitrosomonas oligotropha]